ncbi:unnamed protein product [Zymoseptoria tritici ST99CH_3D1]|nr:unnamed protein product [Zymoseptoria tritici ST99CH_3D1]
MDTRQDIMVNSKEVVELPESSRPEVDIIPATSQLLFTWTVVISVLSLAPLFPLLASEFHLSQQSLSLLTSVCVLTLGFANILLVPLSNVFGRRPTAIGCGVLVVLTNV